MAPEGSEQAVEALNAEILRLLAPGAPPDFAAIQRLIEARSTVIQTMAAQAALRPDSNLLAALMRAAGSGQELTGRLIRARCEMAAELARFRRMRPPAADPPSLSVTA